MAFQGSDPSDPSDPGETIRHSRRIHGGMPEKDLNDDELAHVTEEERVDAGLDAYDPDEVPPATDTPPLDTDVRDTEQYQEERAEIRREEDKDEILIEGEREQFPPTHYE